MNILKPKKTLVLITTISAVLIVYCLNPSLVSAAFFRIWETRGVPEEYGGSVIHGAYQKVATYGGFIYVATDGVSRGVSVSVLDGGTGQPVSPNGVPIQKFFPGIEISDMKFDSSGNLYIIGGDVGAHTTVYKTDPDLNVITSSVLSSTYLWDAHLEVFDDVIDLAGTNLDYNGTLLSLRPSDLSIISGPFIDSGNANGEHQILSIGKTGQLGGVESIFVLNSTDIFEVRNANNFSLVASMNIPGFVTGQQYYRTAFYDGSYIFLIYLNGAQTPYYEIRRIDLNSGTSCSAAGGTLVNGVCQFTGGSCPSGWTYNHWTETSYNSVYLSSSDSYCNNAVRSVFGHSWASKDPESLYYPNPAYKITTNNGAQCLNLNGVECESVSTPTAGCSKLTANINYIGCSNPGSASMSFSNAFGINGVTSINLSQLASADSISYSDGYEAFVGSSLDGKPTIVRVDRNNGAIIDFTKFSNFSGEAHDVTYNPTNGHTYMVFSEITSPYNSSSHLAKIGNVEAGDVVRATQLTDIRDSLNRLSGSYGVSMNWSSSIIPGTVVKQSDFNEINNNMKSVCSSLPTMSSIIRAPDLNTLYGVIESLFENFATKGNTCSAKRVFVTSQTFNGDLGWYPGADAKCQASANNAGLGGTWRAWVSGNGGNTDSVEARFTHSSVPYMTINGNLIANNWADLTNGTIANPINIDEYGNPVTDESFNSTKVWTNTGTDGNFISTVREGNCDNFNTTDLTSWDGIYGDINSKTSTWTKGPDESVPGPYTMPEVTDCERNLRLYCFEQ